MIDGVTPPDDVEEIEKLLNLQAPVKSKFTDSVLEEDKRQTLFHIIAFINHVSMVEELVIPDLERERRQLLEISNKVFRETFHELDQDGVARIIKPVSLDRLKKGVNERSGGSDFVFAEMIVVHFQLLSIEILRFFFFHRELPLVAKLPH